MIKHIVGDALTNILYLISQGVQVDHVFTSPPYFQLYDYMVEGQHGLEADVATYVDNVSRVILALEELLADGSCIFVNVGETFNNYSRINSPEHRREGADRQRRKLQPGILEKQPLRIPHLLADKINESNKLHLRFEYIWDKVNGGGPNSKSDAGTLRHEYVFQFVKWSNRSRMYAKCKPFPHSIVSIPPLKSTTNPCSFPPELPQHFLAHTEKVWTNGYPPVIMDPYGGEHNTGVAASRLQMDYIGIDLKDWRTHL
jgi:DNA modification methylase